MKFVLGCPFPGLQNFNLATSMASGSLVFLEVMPYLIDTDASPSLHGASLRSLMDKLRETLDDLARDPDPHCLVILDDITTLEWVGISVLELSRFCRALCALCRKVRAVTGVSK